MSVSGSSVKVSLTAWNTATNAPATGLAVGTFNLTLCADGADTALTLVGIGGGQNWNEDGNGEYIIWLSGAQNTGTMMSVRGSNSTGNIVIVTCKWNNLQPGSSGGSSSSVVYGNIQCINSLNNGQVVKNLAGSISVTAYLAASPSTVSSGPVTISEFGGNNVSGIYEFAYDAGIYGDAVLKIDFGDFVGGGATLAGDRYWKLDMLRTQSASAVSLAAIKAQTDKLTFDGSNNVYSNPTNAVHFPDSFSALTATNIAMSVLRDNNAYNWAIAGSLGYAFHNYLNASIAALGSPMQAGATVQCTDVGGAPAGTAAIANAGLTSGTINVVIVNPVSINMDLQIVPGDAYDGNTRQAITFTDGGQWPTLGGAEIRCFIAPLSSPLTPIVTATCSVAGAPQVVTVPLTAANTAVLIPGEVYAYQVRANLGSSEILTLVGGQVTALGAITPSW